MARSFSFRTYSGVFLIAPNAPEIAVVASGRHEVTRKRGQYSQTKSGHYSNLFVGRRPGTV